MASGKGIHLLLALVGVDGRTLPTAFFAVEAEEIEGAGEAVEGVEDGEGGGIAEGSGFLRGEEGGAGDEAEPGEEGEQGQPGAVECGGEQAGSRKQAEYQEERGKQWGVAAVLAAFCAWHFGFGWEALMAIGLTFALVDRARARRPVISTLA